MTRSAARHRLVDRFSSVDAIARSRFPRLKARSAHDHGRCREQLMRRMCVESRMQHGHSMQMQTLEDSKTPKGDARKRVFIDAIRHYKT